MSSNIDAPLKKNTLVDDLICLSGCSTTTIIELEKELSL